MKLLMSALVAAFIAISCAKDTGGSGPSDGNDNNKPVDEKTLPSNDESQITKPNLVIISINGFRHDFQNRFKLKSISELAQNGVRAISVRPSFPTQGPSNLFSIATGLFPQNHGVVGNRFWEASTNQEFSVTSEKQLADSHWFKADPLWAWAEKAGMRTAAIDWIGQRASISGTIPSYAFNSSEEVSLSYKMNLVQKWLSLPERNRPHLMMVSLSELFETAQKYGIESNETREVMAALDNEIGKLRTAIRTLAPNFNLILTSEAGIKSVDPGYKINLNAIVDLSGFRISSQSGFMMLYSEDTKMVNRTLNLLKNDYRFTALRKEKVPPYLRFSKSDRIGQIVVFATSPFYFADLNTSQTPLQNASISPTAKLKADQGWDGRDLDMHGIFYAEGPQFKTKTVIPTFDNIDLFPLILNILDIRTKVQTDGNPDTLASIIKN